ncbi:MAG: hypothetical protein MK132_25750 [Lentisphaerales bacterium]|nr:hypothetical protein [Lentisphaerales bacterium]
MHLPKKQNCIDWLTQLWNITKGRKVENSDSWLLGPMGPIGGISDYYVEDLAKSEGLTVHRNLPDSGLMDNFHGFDFDETRLNENIVDFYLKTLSYKLDVWVNWQPVFGTFGYLVRRIFSKRIEQLSLPQSAIELSEGLKSEIILLKDKCGDIKNRIWFRRLKKSDEVVYSGIYSHCQLPSGEKCLKIIFPLPMGSATVIMRAGIDAKGNLELLSQGKGYGDPGFYFLVKDSKGHLWKNYLSSFHERIFVFENDQNELRADHTMSVWGSKAYELHYRMEKDDRINLEKS